MQLRDCAITEIARVTPLSDAFGLVVAGQVCASTWNNLWERLSANRLVRDGPVAPTQGHPLMCRFSRRTAVSLASLPGTPSSSPAAGQRAMRLLSLRLWMVWIARRLLYENSLSYPCDNGPLERQYTGKKISTQRRKGAKAQRKIVGHRYQRDIVTADRAAGMALQRKIVGHRYQRDGFAVKSFFFASLPLCAFALSS